MTHKKIDFFSEVIVKENADNVEIRGEKGVVMGIGEEDGIIYSYSVYIFGGLYNWCVDKNDLIETGRKFKREDFYNGSSIGVTPDGEVTREDIKPE